MSWKDPFLYICAISWMVPPMVSIPGQRCTCIYLVGRYEFITHLHHLFQSKTLVEDQNPMSSSAEFQVVKLPFTQGNVTRPALGFSKRLESQ